MKTIDETILDLIASKKFKVEAGPCQCDIYFKRRRFVLFTKTINVYMEFINKENQIWIDGQLFTVKEDTVSALRKFNAKIKRLQTEAKENSVVKKIRRML